MLLTLLNPVYHQLLLSGDPTDPGFDPVFSGIEIILDGTRLQATMPSRYLDPHDNLPLLVKFENFSFLADDPLESIERITPYLVAEDGTFDEEDTDTVITHQGLDPEGSQVVFDVGGGVNTTRTVIEIALSTELGRTLTGHVKIKWKEGSSQESL